MGSLTNKAIRRQDLNATSDAGTSAPLPILRLEIELFAVYY